MDSDFFIPVEDLLFLDPVKPITEEVEFVVEAVRSSRLLCLSEDEMYVRPDMNVERNVIILRDIPSDCPPERVLSIFESVPHMPINLRSDIGNTWFVTFESEEECTSTLMVIRSRTFDDAPIKCGIKSGSVFGNFFAAAAAAIAQDYYGYEDNAYSSASEARRIGGGPAARGGVPRRRNKTVPSGGNKPFRKRMNKNRRDSVPNIRDSESVLPRQPVSLTADDFPALSTAATSPVATRSSGPSGKTLLDIVRRVSNESLDTKVLKLTTNSNEDSDK
jgi:hypothetical protein